MLLRYAHTGALLAALLPAGPIVRLTETTPATGEWVARQIEERDTGRDGRFEMEMKLYDRRGRETLRRLSLLSHRDGQRDKVLLRFSYPDDIRDTAFLAIENASGEDDRFLYLPSLGRSRRISAQEKQESFVGSDLTYEDISGRRLEDYTYRLLRQELLEASRCYVLESIAIDQKAKYPRAISWVDQETFVVRKADIYDAAGEIAKRFLAEHIDKVDGIWTVRRMSMENVKLGTRTLLDAPRVEYNRGLADELFTRRGLERGGEPSRSR